MVKLVCATPHFGAGGALIPVGTEVETDAAADGVFWIEAEGSKTLEVATPSKAKAKAGE